MLGVSRSGYYNWLAGRPSKRSLANEAITVEIHKIFAESYHSYGAPRVRAELLKRGYHISRPRVARLMRANNLIARRKRRSVATTDSRHGHPIAPNLLERNFTASKENRVWVSDITYIRTKEGWMYLTVIIDLFHRKVVGRSMGETLTAEDTIVPAWRMAIMSNTVTGTLIFHSDRGSQYAGHLFTDMLREHGSIKQSMSRKGNCWDNAVAESFFKSLKVEWTYKHDYHHRSQAELSIFQWIETWYNRRRIHSTLGYKTIEEFKNEMSNQKIAA